MKHAVALVLAAAACTGAGAHGRAQQAVQIVRSTYLHAGFGAGPALFSDDAGRVAEERRYEPFGAAIDAQVGGAAGAPDFAARDLDELGKRVEPATAWVDHGARWMAPATARWLTPDPPVEGPDVKLMAAPWGLHPYQYVDQNPIAYWDPDGRSPATIGNASLRAQIVARFPEGVVRDAALLLADSPEKIAQNTARHLADGEYQFTERSALERVPDSWENVARMSLDTTKYTQVYDPVTHEPRTILKNLAATILSKHIIYNPDRGAGELAWDIVHEVGHDLNGDERAATPFQRYAAEFREAYVEVYRNVKDFDQHADQAKAFVLRNYPDLKQAYDSDATFRASVDVIRLPSGNTDNH